MQLTSKSFGRIMLILGALFLTYWGASMSWAWTATVVPGIPYLPQSLSLPGFFILLMLYGSPWFEIFYRVIPVLYGIIFGTIFLVWNRDLWKGVITDRSTLSRIIIVVAVMLVSILPHAFGSHEYMGSSATTITTLWLVMGLSVLFLCIHAARSPTTLSLFTARFLFLIWASWLAFPYIGELP